MISSRQNRKKRANSTYEFLYKNFHHALGYILDNDFSSENQLIGESFGLFSDPVRIKNLSDEAENHPVEIQKMIIEGGTSNVYFGLWNQKEVAIKIFDFAFSYKYEKDIYCYFARQNDSGYFLTQCYGYIDEKIRYSLVIEYMSEGDLNDFLFKRNGVKLPEEQILKLGLDIAAGIRYMHSHAVLHRDIKSENVLLTKNGYPKLCDFGCSIRTEMESEESDVSEESENEEMSPLFGTIRIFAPELIKNKNPIYSQYSDIYAYGILLYEILHLRSAYNGMETIQMLDFISRYFTPIIHAPCSSSLSTLIFSCWNKIPSHRPTANEIINTYSPLAKK